MHWFTEETNNIIARRSQLLPDSSSASAACRRPPGEPIESAFAELERCVKLGFKGCLLNPDPYENSGTEAPALGDRYWYPLYEKLCELDVPAHIHSTGSPRARALHAALHQRRDDRGLRPGEFRRVQGFPDPEDRGLPRRRRDPLPVRPLRGGSRAASGERFLERMRNLYYDTVLYSKEALRLLIKTVGVDHVLFGAECPGVGSAINPETGRTFDDIEPLIRGSTGFGRRQGEIFEDNARRLFKIEAAICRSG